MNTIKGYEACYRPGLGAVEGKDKKYFTISNTRLIEGSIYIDICSKKIAYKNPNRWDYMIGYNKKLYFVEIHPASTGEVSLVLKKFEWLKEFISCLSNELKTKILITNNPFIWVATNGVHIIPTSPQARLLAKSGISGPVSIVKL